MKQLCNSFNYNENKKHFISDLLAITYHNITYYIIVYFSVNQKPNEPRIMVFHTWPIMLLKNADE